jgi:hypothetical protein
VHSELHRSFSRAGLPRIGDALPDRRVPGSQPGIVRGERVTMH